MAIDTTDIDAYWSMDIVSGGGTNRLDATGNGHAGVVTGPGVVSADGLIGVATEFPIATPFASHLTISDAIDLHYGNIDQSIWGWYQGFDFLAGGAMIFKDGQWLFEAVRSSGHDWIEHYDVVYAAGLFTRLGYSYTWSSPTWEFWMVEYTAATMRANLYRNDPTTPVDTAVMPQVPIFSTNDLLIGESLALIAGNNWALDEIGIASRLFTPAERQELWNGGAGWTYPGPDQAVSRLRRC